MANSRLMKLDISWFGLKQVPQIGEVRRVTAKFPRDNNFFKRRSLRIGAITSQEGCKMG